MSLQYISQYLTIVALDDPGKGYRKLEILKLLEAYVYRIL